MSLKRIITRVISPIKSKSKSLPKLFTIGIITLYCLLSMSSLPNRSIMAFAQAQIADPMSEYLRMAQSKVETATSPGAFGHGVPTLYHMSSQELIMIFGIAVIVGIISYVIYRMLVEHRSKDNNVAMTINS